MQTVGADFKATKDVDIVLTVEALIEVDLIENVFCCQALTNLTFIFGVFFLNPKL